MPTFGGQPRVLKRMAQGARFAPDGKSLGSAALNPPGKGQQFAIVHIPLQDVTDGQYHTLYVLSKPKNAAEKATAGLTFIQFNAK